MDNLQWNYTQVMAVNVSYSSLLVTQEVNSTTPIYDESDIYDKYLPGINSSTKFLRIVMYAFGFPGNLIALLVWIRRPMLQSSGCYLAALALNDLIFLSLDFPYILHTEWHTSVLNVPIICEGFTVLYMTSQYNAPLLTLAFTTERYIAIKFPLKRRIYCTVNRALITVCTIFLISLGLNGIQAYFWTYDAISGECLRRLDAAVLWETWTWSSEMVMFLCVPLMILSLNILVICEIRKSRKIALKLNRVLFKTMATTTMLLAVSSFLILTTLPVSIVYALNESFSPGEDLSTADTDPIWQAHFKYYEARTIIYNIGLTHFVLNFYIYLIAGDRFRREVMKTLRCRSSGRSLSKIYRSETTKMDSFYSSDTM